MLVDQIAVATPDCGLQGNAKLSGLRIRVTQGHTPQSGKIFAPETGRKTEVEGIWSEEAGRYFHGQILADLTRCRKGENHLVCAPAQAGVHLPPLRLIESVRDGPLPAQGHQAFR